ncbi:MAG: ABC transporter ATP-binding protein [Acetatifactor sp.]|nr:ABC transporter ATP-binding protein [Acetatifactor sp.]
MDAAIEITQLQKKFKGFELSVQKLSVPKGFATALIGENGAGKTTLLNILAGIRLDYKGEVNYFDEKENDVEKVKGQLGYTGSGLFFLPQWTIRQVGEVGQLLYDDFDVERFEKYCSELGVTAREKKSKQVGDLSDGNRMKLVIATAFSRDTRCLLMDEPASPLDPLMRDDLCNLIRTYLEEGDGEKSVLFSTHNISDMESVTDYAIIMAEGEVVEQGFVEDLKNKYILVKGNPQDSEQAKQILYTFNSSSYGFEGICLAGNLDRLAGMDVSMEIPSLHQISVAVMKHYATLQNTR